MTFIHISHRLAIITMSDSAPPHSDPVPLPANAFHEFAYDVGKLKEFRIWAVNTLIAEGIYKIRILGKKVIRH